MKQIFTLLLLATGLLAKSTPTKPIETPAVKTFENTYGQNKAAVWTCTAQGCQVEFEHKGQYITAVYNNSGKLRFYKKHILSTQLPVALQMNLKKRMNGYWITDVQETSAATGASYLLTLENGSKKVVLNATGGNWQMIKTVNKA